MDRSFLKTYKPITGIAQGNLVVAIGAVELQALQGRNGPDLYRLMFKDVLAPCSMHGVMKRVV
jgi:hypothetical protein